MLSNNIDRTPEGVLTFVGYDVTQLAKEYGTPLYLMDEARKKRIHIDQTLLSQSSVSRSSA